MERTIISKRCPHCLRALAKSDNPKYAYQCFDCDEDFYNFEARDVTVRFSEPTSEDIAPFLAWGYNIDFSERVKVTVTADGGSPTPSGFCFMERERVERLGEQYVADHAMLEWSSVSEEYNVSVSQNDWYNDPSRYPEQVIPVRFVEIERGTGREVYRSKDGFYYLREVYYPRENCAKWYKCGKRRRFEDGDPVTRPNVIFDNHGHREKVRYDDWNGVMAYSDTFNKNFQQFSGVG